jgi:hypothetical protein
MRSNHIYGAIIKFHFYFYLLLHIQIRDIYKKNAEGKFCPLHRNDQAAGIT